MDFKFEITKLFCRKRRVKFRKSKFLVMQKKNKKTSNIKKNFVLHDDGWRKNGKLKNVFSKTLTFARIYDLIIVVK